MEKSKETNSPLDNMNELHEWMTTWEKFVTKDTRKREPDNNSEQPRRKRVVLKKTKS